VSKLPSTGPSLQRWLRQQARQAQRLQQSSAFARSGTSVTAKDVTEVDGTLNVVGNLNVSGPAAITGTLSLPAGIIGNDALTSPVVPSSQYVQVTNFGLTVAWAAKATISVTVPVGFTTLQVMAASRIGAYNSTAIYDSLYSKITIGAATQGGFLTGVGSGTAETSVSALTATLPGLTPGATVDIVLWGSTGSAAWAVDARNGADLSASLLWLR